MGSNLEDDSQMIPCERFRGEPCSSSGSQPFRVILSAAAAIFMEFHAHLSDNEVIGLLGGSWNSQERLLRSALQNHQQNFLEGRSRSTTRFLRRLEQEVCSIQELKI